MSGVAAQALSHVVRRGLEQFPTTSDGTVDPKVFTGHDEVKFDMPIWTVVLGVLVALFATVVILSVDYTVGSVMASLAMIESPSSTTIVESAPPAYADEPDAPLEKKGDFEDVEVVVINHKPITASVIGTIKHLHRVGGFRARWRGLGQSILYQMTLHATSHILGAIFSVFTGSFVGTVLGFAISFIGLCRLHMLSTHAMIAAPTDTPWYKRFVDRKQCRPLLLASFFYVLAQQAVIAVPAAVFILTPFTIQGFSAGEATVMVVWIIAIVASFFVTILYVYLPAAATLARIEACLLPEDQQTIVPFDRTMIMGDIDVTERCASKKLYSAAWKSFSGAARARLVKLFVKLVAFEVAVFLVAVHIVGALFYLNNKDQVHTTISQISQNL